MSSPDPSIQLTQLSQSSGDDFVKKIVNSQESMAAEQSNKGASALGQGLSHTKLDTSLENRRSLKHCKAK